MEASSLISLVAGIPFIGPFAAWAPVVVIVCSAIDAACPQPIVGSIWVIPRKVISAISLSIMNARNAVPAGSREAIVVIAVDEAATLAKKFEVAGTTP